MNNAKKLTIKSIKSNESFKSSKRNILIKLKALLSYRLTDRRIIITKNDPQVLHSKDSKQIFRK